MSKPFVEVNVCCQADVKIKACCQGQDLMPRSRSVVMVTIGCHGQDLFQGRWLFKVTCWCQRESSRSKPFVEVNVCCQADVKIMACCQGQDLMPRSRSVVMVTIGCHGQDLLSWSRSVSRSMAVQGQLLVSKGVIKVKAFCQGQRLLSS